MTGWTGLNVKLAVGVEGSPQLTTLRLWATCEEPLQLAAVSVTVYEPANE